jgi:CheY-like chemotaxis protein/HPt (histidine-containing phosphotransfer) domain-containing protein
MALAQLDTATLENLRPPSRGQIDVWDANLPGFGIRLSQGGSKSWVVMVRRGGRRVRLTLGPYPDLSPDTARNQAAQYLSPRHEGRPAARMPEPDSAGTGLTSDLIATARGVLVLLQTALDAEMARSPARRAETIAPSIAGRDGRRPRILLAEDTDTNRMLALAMLAVEPYDIDTATNGREAVEAAKTNVYDLILMDVSMPVMDGLEAAHAIRALPGLNATVPIIAMTAHAMTSDRDRCLAAGMTDYVSKPVSRALLIEKIAARLGTQPAARDARAPLPAVLDARVLDQLSQDLRLDTLGGFIDTLLPDIQNRVRGIYAAEVAGNLAALGTHAHSLISLASTFGAYALESLARTIEDRARAGAAEALPPLLDALRPVVDETVAALAELRQRSA